MKSRFEARFRRTGFIPTKTEARNPKHEIRNKHECQKEESTKQKARVRRLRFVVSWFGDLNSFRISCFGFRISNALTVTCVVLSVLISPLGVRAQPAPDPDALPPRLDDGVARGLAFLAKQQAPDGSFESNGPRVATTALAMMAFLASGHPPAVGQHGQVVRNAEDYLLKQIPADGYFGKVDGSRMYGQGITTLALAEVAGVEPDPNRRATLTAALASAVKVILVAQDVSKGEGHAGGWRYEPQSADSDLSLSGWNALALRAAQNAGVDVPKDRVARAVAYVLKCYRNDQKGFAYQPAQNASVPMTGVAALNLYLLDASDRPELKEAGEYLTKQPVTENTRFAYYSAYYATQAAFQAGGPTWRSIWTPTMDRLLALQMDDGGWPTSKTGEEPGRVYSTSMSVLTLTVPYRLLPIYQR
jgi:hypothetical protein